MSPTSRRKGSTVIGQLTNDPNRYQFLQAVRLVLLAEYYRRETDNTKSMGVAQYSPPSREFIRFLSNPGLGFTASEISSIIAPKPADTQQRANQWQMTVDFMGLIGASGTLPYHYSEAILQQLRSKNYSLRDFLELFNHRTISLFYRASSKYRLPLQFEQSKLGVLKNPRDDFTQSLLSIIGLGTKHLTHRLLTNDEALLRYSGLFSQSVRTATGLVRMLSEHFGYTVSIDQFRGQWQQLLPDLTSRLTSKQYPRGCNVQLGKDAKLGSKGWFMQGRVVLNIGPLNLDQFNTLAPGSRKLASLKEVVRLYVGIEQDFEINITLRREDSNKNLELGKGKKPILGWNSWFATKHVSKSKQDIIKIRISANF